MRRALLAAMLLATTSVAAQTAEEIISRYIRQSGGMERIQAVRTLRRGGKYVGGGGFEARFQEEHKRPNRVRQEFYFQGMTGVNAWDGSTGWKIEPWGGKKDVEPLSEEETKSIIADADFDGPLVNYQEKGNKVEYLGTEPIEGTDTHKLRVTLAATGEVRTYYLDSEYHLPIRMDTRRMVRGAEREYETSFGDYKPVNGWYLPHFVETGTKGSPFRAQYIYDTIEANTALANTQFAKPGTKAPPDEPDVERASARSPEPEMPEPRAEARATSVKIDSDTISGLGARNIGSAAMSGRIAALDAVREGQRLTIYAGSASGGVWKSVNGGTTFKPVFDKQSVQSIGALTIDPKNPKTIWVGTGESWTRNSVSIGDGIYKSVDGGDNWTHMGLKDSERITRIAVDPTDSNNVYVCVPGKLWSDSEERGVYKTTDGGKTWTKVLKGANASTGCSMLSLDAKNPKTIYAGLWDFRRKGWTFRSGGEGPTAFSGSGLHKSTDGGATWTEITGNGLPAKPWGRVAVTVAPSNPSTVYAMIEAEAPHNGLYRSGDGGRTWELRDRSQNMVWRPFYFAHLIVDPKDENKVYKPNLSLIASNDGGKSFSNVSGATHGDHHDLWIDPQNTDHLITGDDGGIWYSYDGGNRWWKGNNLPVSQFYHVSVDNELPYNVYGGLQDNSSWVGASEYPGGITNKQWENMYGGDGFWMFVDPTDPNYIYAEAQGGNIARIHRKTHEIRDIRPLPAYKEGKLRFNWNTPIHISPTTGAVYLGAQVLFRTKNQGQTWERISPDLTTNDPNKQKQELSGGITVDNSAAEMHTTIYAISESPKNANVIWVGTDDGNVQVTRDGGKSWTNVVANIPGLPKNAWVSYIDAGHFDEGTAYATFDMHTFGDMRPYAYRTTDFGRTWTSLIPADAPVKGYAHVLREDLVNRDLLFLGTELGLWISIDGGKQWAQYKGGDLPNVAVRDLVVHPREHDLVIATHGRGIWIVDDITPLRALTPEVLEQDIAFVGSTTVVQPLGAFGGWSDGDAEFTGPNPPSDAVVTYYQKKRHIFGDLKIDVTDAGGKSVATIPSSKRRGLNRVAWPMRLPGPQVPTAATAAFGASVGPRVVPGTYTVNVTKDKNAYSTKLTLVPDPRTKHSRTDRQAQFDLAMKLHGQLGEMTKAVQRLNNVRLGLDDRAAKLGDRDALAKKLRAASSQVDTLRKRIVATREGGMITGEERLREFLADLYGNVNNYEGRPSAAHAERADALARELGDVVRDFDAWMAKELPALNAALARKKLEPVKP
ncbi:MAG TPA: sialidase [Thermoanaerobaculia bacterium]|nr:sialidase [Thermoanaerobaculia bacterium]